MPKQNVEPHQKVVNRNDVQPQVNLEEVLLDIEKNFDVTVSQKETIERAALEKYGESMSEGKDEEAKYVLFQYFNSQVRVFQGLKSRIPNQKSKNENSKSRQLSQMIQTEVDNLKKLQKELNVDLSDVVKSKIENMPGKIEENIGKSSAVLRKLYSKLEARKKTGGKLSESEMMDFFGEINEEEEKFNNLKNKLEEKTPGRIKSKNEEAFDFLLTKIKATLEKGVDESVEKFKKLDGEMDKLVLDIAKINSEIVKEIEDKGKIKDELKEKLIFNLMEIYDRLIALQEGAEKIAGAFGEEPTEEQIRKLNSINAKLAYSTTCYYNTEQKLENKKEYNAKDQRSAAVAISDRIRTVEKNMNEDYDKLSVGKKYSSDQKEAFEVMLDVEIISVREAEKNLNSLEDIPENQPTRSLVANIIERAKKRIEILKEKLDKERAATEKEINEKLDAAEKEIEKIEENIRDVNRKDSEGKMRFDENYKSKGKLDNLWTPFVKYNNGQTYHNQINVRDSLADPKEIIKEAKDWIEKMPEGTDKEQKLKKRLMKKARRMNRRVTSAKWRHYMTLGAYHKGAYLGDKLGSAIVGKIGDGLDRVFG